MLEPRSFLLFAGRAPLAAAFLLVVTTVGLAAGIPRVVVDANQDALLVPNDPALSAYEEAAETFGSDIITLLYLQAGDLFGEAQLSAAAESYQRLASAPNVERVDSVFSLSAIVEDSSAQGVIVGPIFDPLNPTSTRYSSVSEVIAEHPVLSRLIVSDDRQSMVMIVVFRSNLADPKANEEAFNLVEDEVVALKPAFDEVFQIGTPRVFIETRRGIGSDLARLAPFVIAVISAIIFLFLRSWLAVCLPLVTGLVSLAWTFGVLGWLGVPLNLMSGGLPVLIIAVGATEDMHLFVRFHRASAETTHINALYVMARKTGLATFLTALTTAIGLSAGALSEIPLVRDFAIAAALAMALNFIATILFVPMALRVWRANSERALSPTKLSDHAARILSMFAKRFSWFAVGTALLLLTAGFWSYFSLSASNDPYSLLGADHPLRVDARTAANAGPGVQSMYVILKSDAPGSFYEPELLNAVSELVGRVRSESAFDEVTSVTDFLSYVGTTFGERPPDRALPNDAFETEQFLLLFDPNEVRQLISVNGEEINLVIRHDISNSTQLLDELSRFQVVAKSLLPHEIDLSVTGKNLIIHQSSLRLVETQVYAFGGVISVVFIIILIVFQRLSLALLMLLPNLLPAAGVLIVMNVLGLALNVGSSLVLAISLGVVVDNTIHLLSGFRQEYRSSSNVYESIERSLAEHIPAVVTTTLALSLGILVLQLSNFQVLAEFGLLSAAAVLVGGIGDILVTPALLAWSAGKKSARHADSIDLSESAA